MPLSIGKSRDRGNCARGGTADWSAANTRGRRRGIRMRPEEVVSIESRELLRTYYSRATSPIVVFASRSPPSVRKFPSPRPSRRRRRRRTQCRAPMWHFFLSLPVPRLLVFPRRRTHPKAIRTFVPKQPPPLQSLTSASPCTLGRKHPPGYIFSSRIFPFSSQYTRTFYSSTNAIVRAVNRQFLYTVLNIEYQETACLVYLPANAHCITTKY